MTLRAQPRRRLEHHTTFKLLVLTVLMLMATASAPSPIYPVYRYRWDFSVSMLTVIFAVYAVGLLAALLTAGSLSDHLGRRPVLVAAALVAAASTLIFSVADGVPALILARLVQGIATGLATGALAAALVEFEPASRPGLGPTLTGAVTGLGMALGSALSGLLLGLTSRPDRYVFPVLTVVLLGVSGALLLMPDHGTRRPGALRSLSPDVRVPAEVRRTFLATVPTTVAGWAATGLFLAIIPSLVTGVLHVHLAAAGGLSIAGLFVAVSAGGLGAARFTAAVAVRRGAWLLAVGAAGLAAAIGYASFPVLGVGAILTGLGVGMTFNGNLRELGAASTVAARSQVFSASYLVSYGALSVATVLAGVAAPELGLRVTGVVYALVVALLALSGVARISRGCRSLHRPCASGSGR
jgi:MFS family permease